MNKLRQAVLGAMLLSGCVLAAPSFAAVPDANPTPQPKDQSNTGSQSAQGAAKAPAKSKSVQQLGGISVTANTVNQLAPSAPPLEATQPTSVIDTRFIRDALRLDSNFDDIIKYSPSIAVTSPEGPGMGKNEGISIRGFQDGQFNITFDGIPFGDASDLHHVTSSYFTNRVLGQAEIDRGPGGGSTVGNATFGGTIGLRTVDPSAESGVTPYITFGSWNTRAAGVSADTKLTQNTNAFFDISKQSSDTFLKGTDDKREHLFVKTVTQLGTVTKLTFVSSYNKEHQNTVQGATKDEIAEFGYRYGLTNNPLLQSYAAYNAAEYYSSFNYLGLTTQWGNWSVDNKVYYITFSHTSLKATDATDNDPADNGVKFYDASGKKLKTAAADVPGNLANSHFRNFGDLLRLQNEIGPGTFETGMWLERSLDGQWSIPIDETTGERVGTKYGDYATYLLTERADTVQPYVQYDWDLTDQLTLSPGLRYSQLTRKINAPLDKGAAGTSLYANSTYSTTLPSLTLHDQFTNEWTGYAQAAKGFLAPPINVIEANGAKTLSPEVTTNYQIGTAFASSKYTFGADLYYIDFSNFITETEVTTDIGNENVYVNSGGVIYKGAEGEFTYGITDSWSLYGNASYNKATYKNSNVRVAEAPKTTAAMGLLYNGASGLYGSLMSKFVGEQYGLDNTTDAVGNTVFEDSQRLGGYMAVDGTLGFRSQEGGFGGKGYAISMNVNNLFNVHKLSQYAGTQKVSGEALFFGLPGRGVFFDLSMKF